MRRHAAGATPWNVVVPAACLIAVLMGLVRWDAGGLWPFEGSAVGLLAGTVALCFDDRVADVVDTLPRSLAWRTGARCVGPACLLSVWTVVVLAAGDGRLLGHTGGVLLQGWAAALLVTGIVTWRRSGGADEPGVVLAGWLIPVATAWAIVHPLADRFPIFPYVAGTDADWRVSGHLWLGVSALGAALLTFALADARWWSARWRTRLLRERMSCSDVRHAAPEVGPPGMRAR